MLTPPSTPPPPQNPHQGLAAQTSLHDFYSYLTAHIVAGPHSWSYFVPPLVLFPFSLLFLVPAPKKSARTGRDGDGNAYGVGKVEEKEKSNGSDLANGQISTKETERDIRDTIRQFIIMPLIIAFYLHAWFFSYPDTPAPRSKWDLGWDVMSVVFTQWTFIHMVLMDWRSVRRVWWEDVEEDTRNGDAVIDTGSSSSVQLRSHAPAQAEQHKQRQGKETKTKKRIIREQAYPEDSMLERIQWTFALIISLRFEGWRIGDEKHDRRQPWPMPVPGHVTGSSEGVGGNDANAQGVKHRQIERTKMSRRQYVKKIGSILLLQYIVLDVASYFAALDPYYITSGMSVDAPFPSSLPSATLSKGTSAWRPLDSLVLPLLWRLPPRLVRTAISAGQVWAMVWAMFLLPSILAVGLNSIGLVSDTWSPHNWSPLFGSFSAIGKRGLRGLWGTWWHQVNRQMSSMPGRALSRLLIGDDSSTLGYMIVAVVSFFNSGCLHSGMIPPQPLMTDLSPNALRLRLAGFFWIQALGFGIELLLAKTIQRVFPKASTWPGASIAVICWVIVWLCASLPLLMETFRELGNHHTYPVPISIFRGLSGQSWWT